MDFSNLLTERRVRVIPPKISLTTKGLKQLKRMGVEFPEDCDALFEFHRNYEKNEVHIRHMGLSPVEVEWYFRPREIEVNKFVKKVVFQGDTVHLKRAFEFTSSLSNLNRVIFTIGRRETVDFHYNFGVSELKNIPKNANVSELEISTDWYHYINDNEKGKEITKKLILATLRYAKSSFTKIRKLRIHLPKTEDILKIVENVWSFYFPKVEFKYTTDIKDGLSKILVSHEEQLLVSILPLEEKTSALEVADTKLVSPQQIPTKQKIRRVSSHSSVSSQVTVDAEVLSDQDQYSNVSADDYDPDKQEFKKFKRPYGPDDDVNPPPRPPLPKRQKSLEEFAKNNEFIRPKRRDDTNIEALRLPGHFSIPIQINPASNSSVNKPSKLKPKSNKSSLPKEFYNEWDSYFEESEST